MLGTINPLGICITDLYSTHNLNIGLSVGVLEFFKMLFSFLEPLL